MRNGLAVSVILGIAFVAASTAASAQANQSAQSQGKAAASKAAPAPTRNVDGVWAGPVQARMNTTPPMTPWGQQQFNANSALGGVSQSKISIVAAGVSNDPAQKCDPAGLPLAVVWQLRGMQFISTPTKMVQMYQYQRTWREIWTDGRALPKNVGGDQVNAPDPRYYGYSVGHWEGDYTFVVDTVGMDPRTWVDHVGHPHSDQLNLEEKYTRTDHDNMQNVVTVDDPKAYTKPYVATTVNWHWNPKQEFEEQLCIPSDAQAYMNFIANPAAAPTKSK